MRFEFIEYYFGEIPRRAQTSEVISKYKLVLEFPLICLVVRFFFSCPRLRFLSQAVRIEAAFI
jgi:hypothetical protein